MAAFVISEAESAPSTGDAKSIADAAKDAMPNLLLRIYSLHEPTAHHAFITDSDPMKG